MKITILAFALAVTALLAVGRGSGPAQAQLANGLEIIDVRPVRFPATGNTIATLQNFQNPANVRFRWSKAGSAGWGNPIAGKLVSGSQFSVPGPGGPGGERWLCAVEGRQSDVWEECLIVTSGGRNIQLILTGLHLRGIVADASVQAFEPETTLSVADSAAFLSRVLADEGRPPAPPGVPTETWLVDQGVWTAEEATAYATAQTSVSREDFATWLVRARLGGPCYAATACRNPLALATRQELVVGYTDGQLKWLQPATRGEAALMLDRTVVQDVMAQPAPAPAPPPPPPPE